MNFYTNVTRHRNQILVRGISDGKPVKFSVKYKPYLFVQANAQTEHKNLKGEYVGKMQFDSMSETREFLQSYENVAGMNIYGLSDWPYMYIYDKYKGEIRYDPALISVCSIDIETSIEGGFPDIEEADKEITGITIGRNGRKTTFGCGEYKEHQDNVQYYKCADESALLLAFLEVWNGSLYSPDVVTGWNIEFFDIPYLVNRIRKILGSDHAERLSPWKMLREYKVNSRGRECICYAPIGIAVLDEVVLEHAFAHVERLGEFLADEGPLREFLRLVQLGLELEQRLLGLLSGAGIAAFGGG
jgi:DNA polymerase elongation subunit (family B)